MQLKLSFTALFTALAVIHGVTAIPTDPIVSTDKGLVKVKATSISARQNIPEPKYFGEGTVYEIPLEGPPRDTACGYTIPWLTYAVAVSSQIFDLSVFEGYPVSVCGRWIYVWGAPGVPPVFLEIVDRCEDCAWDDIAISEVAFGAITGGQTTGSYNISWAPSSTPYGPWTPARPTRQ